MQIKNNPKKSKIGIVKPIVALSILIICGLSAYLIISSLNILNNNDQGSPEEGSKTSDGQNQVKGSAGDGATNRVDNKTPIQYEGEKSGDTPGVSDERFRIPENQP